MTKMNKTSPKYEKRIGKNIYNLTHTNLYGAWILLAPEVIFKSTKKTLKHELRVCKNIHHLTYIYIHIHIQCVYSMRAGRHFFQALNKTKQNKRSPEVCSASVRISIMSCLRTVLYARQACFLNLCLFAEQTKRTNKQKRVHTYISFCWGVSWKKTNLCADIIM